MDTFTSIFTKKFMIWLFSRVRHYLTITLRSPADNRGFFYLNNDFVLIPYAILTPIQNFVPITPIIYAADLVYI
ncbi:hypothetical protein BW897_31495 [Bacillus cereus]|uniref:Uncharacterized protein n=1 Tax=Bacillus cereus TaxID=1396 RepID=A0A1S9T5Y4_BACCE|nr:hypothetical protein BW897_31495 [Bacillus cereus]